MMHGRHSPVSLGLAAHRHAPSAQHAPRRFNRELVFVPDRFSDRVKSAFLDFQPRCRLLVKVALAKIPDGLLAAIKFRAHGEQHDLRVETLGEGFFVRLVERIQAASHLAFHLGRKRIAAILACRRYVHQLTLHVDRCSQFRQEVYPEDAVDLLPASVPDCRQVDSHSFNPINFAPPTTTSFKVTSRALVANVPVHEVTRRPSVRPSVNDLRFSMELAAVSTRNNMGWSPTITSMTGSASQCLRGISCACAAKGAEPTVGSRARSANKPEKERIPMVNLWPWSISHNTNVRSIYFSVLHSSHAQGRPLSSQKGRPSPPGPRAPHSPGHSLSRCRPCLGPGP